MLVEHIFTASAAGEPCVSHQNIRAIEGRGLEGDRYAAGEGFWQGTDARKGILKPREVSFITIAGLAFAAKQNNWEEQLSAAEIARLSRRNIVLNEGDLTTLENQEFQIGGAVFEGIGECDPCNRPNQLSGGLLPGFGNKVTGVPESAGIRAIVLSSGLVAVGNAVEMI